MGGAGARGRGGCFRLLWCGGGGASFVPAPVSSGADAVLESRFPVRGKVKVLVHVLVKVQVQVSHRPCVPAGVRYDEHPTVEPKYSCK